MSASSPSVPRWWGAVWRLLPLAAIVLFAIASFLVAGDKGMSLEALVRNRAIIDDFVDQRRVMSVGASVIIYVVTVAVSLPGAIFLTVRGASCLGSR